MLNPFFPASKNADSTHAIKTIYPLRQAIRFREPRFLVFLILWTRSKPSSTSKNLQPYHFTQCSAYNAQLEHGSYGNHTYNPKFARFFSITFLPNTSKSDYYAKWNAIYVSSQQENKLKLERNTKTISIFSPARLISARILTESVSDFSDRSSRYRNVSIPRIFRISSAHFSIMCKQIKSGTSALLVF